MTLSPPNRVQGGYPLGLAGATAATRYVGATSSGAPASGTFAVGDFVIDRSGAIYVCTVAGTPGTWVAIGAGGSAFYDSTAGVGGVSEFDVTNIPATAKAIRWVIAGRAEDAVTTRDVRMQFNGDTGNNYAYQRAFSHSGNNYSGATSSATLANYIGEMPGASASAGRASQHGGIIENYAGAVFNKLTVVTGGRVADLNLLESVLNSYFATPAAITRMRFFLLQSGTANAGGDFAEGTRLTVWLDA